VCHDDREEYGHVLESAKDPQSLHLFARDSSHASRRVQIIADDFHEGWWAVSEPVRRSHGQYGIELSRDVLGNLQNSSEIPVLSKICEICLELFSRDEIYRVCRAATIVFVPGIFPEIVDCLDALYQLRGADDSRVLFPPIMSRCPRQSVPEVFVQTRDFVIRLTM
jgi:hypothetical protein